MIALPAGLEESFRTAAAELGMCSAATLFVRETAAEGAEAVAALRDRLGRAFPVLDAVATGWLDDAGRLPTPDVDPVVRVLDGTRKLVVVGLEAMHLDALVPRLPDTQLALLTHADLPADWDRVLANWGGRVVPVGFHDFQAWAGPRSALLTFAYGHTALSTHVAPAWLRILGEDVRAQFRSLVGWDVLAAPMFVYPRWLVEAPLDGFTDFCA